MIGVRGRDVAIAFRENGRTIRAVVPDDALWSGVLFVLLLRAYERSGLRLDDVHGTVLDAGAHAGLFSLSAAAHGNKVVAVEAHPAMYAMLDANVASSRMDNIVCLNRAVAGVAGSEVTMSGRDSISATITGPLEAGSRVTTVTIDELIASYGPVDLLKMNIEGAEFEAVEAASDGALRAIHTLVIECHGGDVDGIVRRLRGLDFDVAIEMPLFFSWREPVLRVFRNWRRVRGLARLKVVAVLMFSAAALVRPFVNIAEAADVDSLRYVFARQRA